MTNCNKCGAENAQNAKFCVSCGNPLGETTSPRQERNVPTNREDQDIQINVNLDFAKKGVDTFKTLSKNQQVMAGLVFVAIIVFFFVDVAGGGGESGSFYEIMQIAKEKGGKESERIVKYIWILFIIPTLIGGLIYMYNFYVKSSLQKLKVLLGINFIATGLLAVFVFLWLIFSILQKESGISSESGGLLFGFYLYVLSFVGILAISTIEIINLFRKRK